MSKTVDEVKVDLKVLRRLVAELEEHLAGADAILAEKADGNTSDYVVEMSKSMGLAAGVSQEAALLVSDMRRAIKINTAPVSKGDDLADLLGGVFKGSGGLPGSN